MKECFCGCGARIEFEDFETLEVSPISVDGNRFDMIKICTNTVRNQILPRLHMQFEFDKSDSGNGSVIYNRYGDIIHCGEFGSYDCPCLGKRVPI